MLCFVMHISIWDNSLMNNIFISTIPPPPLLYVSIGEVFQNNL